MSTDTIYIITAILVFPALWLLAWILDRFWPSMSEREAQKRKAKVEKAKDA